MPELPRPEQPLTDGVVALRAWTADDIPRIAERMNDPDIARWTRVPSPYTAELAEAYMAEMEERRRAGRELALVTTDAADGELLGTHNLRVTSSRHRRGELGATVFRQARGRSVSARAGILLARYGFERAGLARVEIRAARENTAVRQATEKAGFTLEGTLRSYLETDAGRTDIVVYSLLPGDV